MLHSPVHVSNTLTAVTSGLSDTDRYVLRCNYNYVNDNTRDLLL